jgi:hypothetical protein
MVELPVLGLLNCHRSELSFVLASEVTSLRKRSAQLVEKIG